MNIHIKESELILNEHTNTANEEKKKQKNLTTHSILLPQNQTQA